MKEYQLNMGDGNIRTVIDKIFQHPISYNNWKSKYMATPDELPYQTFRRVAKAVASVEGKNKEKYEKEFFNLMVSSRITDDNKLELNGLKFTPGGRITSNAGTSNGKATLMNCYGTGPVTGANINYTRKYKAGEYNVNLETDDTPDDLINIFLTIAEQAKTLAAEGGYGINFDFIRPRGSIIKGTGVEHPGVVSYMDIWNATAECIVKGNNDGYQDKLVNYLSDEEKRLIMLAVKEPRKGAMMGSLSVWHPDIEEFIKAKVQYNKLNKFNISVMADNKFLEAIINDDLYDLHFDGVVYKRVKARDLYDLIITSAYNTGEPGILFYDNIIDGNPIEYIDTANSTNPCGEIPTTPNLTTVCLLGSLNLTKYIHSNIFHWNEYVNDIFTAVRFLDNVNDLSYQPLPQYDNSVSQLRQIGLGINGFGSACVMLGMNYNDNEAYEFMSKLSEYRENYAWQASALLAKEKGVFPLYDKDKFTNTKYYKNKDLWSETRKLIEEHGVRNAKTTTIPPLGNSSVICGNISNGCEPIFSLQQERFIMTSFPEGLNMDNVKSKLKKFKDHDFEYWRGEFNGKEYYYEPHNRGLCEVVSWNDYSYEFIKNGDKKITPNNVVTTRDLTAIEHLKMQAVAQKYCNQSISKTINIPAEYPLDDLKNIYIEGWKMGLIGMTTYRDQSRGSVITELKDAAETGNIIKHEVKLPETFLNGPTHKIKREGMKFYIHFSYYPEDTDMRNPIAIWIITNQTGEAKACNKACNSLEKLAKECGIPVGTINKMKDESKGDKPHNKLARMISLNLRHGVPREDILVSLTGIEGDNVSTLLTAVRKFIGKTIDDGKGLVGIKCPNCGGTNLKMESGCFTCADCDYAGCG